MGALTETVTVEAQSANVQTASAERSGVLTSRQVLDLAETGRSLFDLTKTLPGVVYTGGLGGVAANGNRNNQNNFTLDGVTNVDTGSNGGTLATTNMDMIAEMKVITNSQPAELGRSSGAQIEVVTKSGTKDFHGTGYWFHRHEGLNANTWRNNIDGRARPFYRYNFYGFNVGGPAYIPGKFNKDKNKFFFFVGIEWQKQLVPNSLSNVTVPTALERTGDFSQSHDGGNAPLTIKDPTNNGSPVPRQRDSEEPSQCRRREDSGLLSAAQRAGQGSVVQLPVAGFQYLSAPRGRVSRRLQHQRQVEDVRPLHQQQR